MPEVPTGSPRSRSDFALAKRLLREARPFRQHLVGVFLLGLLATPLALVFPLPIQVVVDGVVGGKPLTGIAAALIPDAMQADRDRLLVAAAFFVVAVGLVVQLHDLALWVWRTWTGERLVLSLRATLFRHLQRLSLTFHDTKGSADAVYRLQNDADSIQQLTIQGLLPLVTLSVRVAAMVYVVSHIDLSLALVALVAGPALFLVTQLYRARIRRGWKEVRETESGAMAVVQESLGALRVVKAFGREDLQRERYEAKGAESLRARLRAVFAHGSFDLVTGLVVAVGTAAVLVIGANHVRDGVITLGQLLVVMGYLSMLFTPLRELGARLADVQKSLASAERVFALLDEPVEAIERVDAVALDRARGAVTFDRVSFGYDAERPILKDVSLDVMPGARVGIAGRSGSGKSTLLSLLPRFYDPVAGRVLLDGVDLRDYRLADLRSQFAIVLQDPVLFSTTIRENIAYAKPAATQAEIEHAARLANVHDLVVTLPQGYDTPVGERGMKLSGGERQRISLARAFLKDAPILLLDEPTSSVDTRTEEGIIDAVERLMIGRTTFLIAHRLSTLEGCDVRLEVIDGRVVQATAETKPE